MFCTFTSPYGFQLKYKSLNTQVKSNNLVFAAGGGGGVEWWNHLTVDLAVLAEASLLCCFNVTSIKHMSIWKLISIFEQLQGDR